MTMTSKKIPLVFATVEGVGSLAMSAYAATPGDDLTALICCQQPNSQCITIDYVYLQEYGYVTVYQSDAQGKPTGIPIGYVSLKAGNHRYINVTLNKQPRSEATAFGVERKQPAVTWAPMTLRLTHYPGCSDGNTPSRHFGIHRPAHGRLAA